ncbi:MAG: 4Fe-4S cluster-binding domain-containing protein, partial [Crenarchaeota archaeon]|nr:4Fe-4S cluster-binding domain-containing protein [Thermoproteota archaeon]
MSKITSFSDFIYSDEKIYLCHTLQFNIIELDQITKLKIENAILTESLDGFTDEEISILTSEKFIVDDGFDDEQFRYLSANYLNTKNSDSHTIKLDIPITDRCNFICPYCFEKGRKRLGITKLDNSVFDNFKKSIFKYLSCRITDKTKKLYVVWYGGEPLVESDNILKLNDAFIEYCNAKNIIYEQEIITNGFLLNDYFIDNIKRQNLSHIQITLDGDKEYHNLRRTTPEKIDTFTTIIANILKCLNQKIEIVVRI